MLLAILIGGGAVRRSRGWEKAPGGKGGGEAAVPWRRSGVAGEGKGGSDDAQEEVEMKASFPRRIAVSSSPHRVLFILILSCATAASSSLTTATPPPSPPLVSHLLAAMCLARAAEINGRENRVVAWVKGGRRWPSTRTPVPCRPTMIENGQRVGEGSRHQHQLPKVKSVKLRPGTNTHSGCGIDGEFCHVKGQILCSLLPEQCKLIGRQCTQPL